MFCRWLNVPHKFDGGYINLRIFASYLAKELQTLLRKSTDSGCATVFYRPFSS